jgi:2,5-diketo-D-gluconate reductase B
MNELLRPGLGTWENERPEQCIESVLTALDIGYRHIDTAQSYKNEEYVGKALQQTDVDREEIALATKVNRGNLAYVDVVRTVKESMRKLQVDYLDLLYVHWPVNVPMGELNDDTHPREHKYPVEDTWRAFNKLHDEGLVKEFGVANFTREQVEEANEHSARPITALQVETHPLNPQRELVAYTRDQDMSLVAYSPLARAEILDVPEVVEVADKHGISPAQVSLAWLMTEPHVVPIPMADVEAHIRENFAARDIELDEDDVRKIDSIEKRQKMVDPRHGVWNW